MLLRYMISLFLLSLQSLSAEGIEAYFKQVTDKSSCRSINHVDFIYMINLDERPEKFASCIEQLAPYGINPCRFSAVNGWKLSYEAIEQLGVKYARGMKKDLWGTTYESKDGTPSHEVMHKSGRTYFCHCMSRGAIGICLSHLSILQDAYNSGYQTIWVMEDDIQVLQNPHCLSQLIEKLDKLTSKEGKKWDILFTDQDTKNQQGNYVPCSSFARKPNFSPRNTERFSKRVEYPSFRRIGARYGAYSMIVRRSGMEKILKFMKQYKIFLPYDMEFYLPEDIVMFAVTQDVVSTQPRALSDNGSPPPECKR